MRINILCIIFISCFALKATASDLCGNILNQEKLIDCLGLEYEKEDKILNSTYTELRKNIPNSGKAKLKEAQKSWLIYRDKDCDFQASAAEGGQVFQPLYISCLIEKTSARTSELKNSSW